MTNRSSREVIPWAEFIKRMEAGETHRALATELGLTIHQFRNRLRKYRQLGALDEISSAQNEEAATMDPSEHGSAEALPLPTNSSGSENAGEADHPNLFDESWTRSWQINRIVLMVKEPTSVFVYWEADPIRRDLVSRHFQSAWWDLPFYLQLYDVTDINFTGGNAHSVRRIQVYPDSDNWHIHHVEPHRKYLVDFGTTTLQNNFFTILRSNIVETPPVKSHRETEEGVQFGPRFCATN